MSKYSKIRIIHGDNWIDDKLVEVTFIQAKDCNFDKTNYNKILQNDDSGVIAESTIYECYMKHRIGGDDDEYGKYFWQVCDKSERGASLFYYAKIKSVD